MSDRSINLDGVLSIETLVALRDILLDANPLSAAEYEAAQRIDAEIFERRQHQAKLDAVALDKLAKILQNDDCVFVAELRQIVQATGRDVETRRAG